MKLYTPDRSVLMHVTSVKAHADGVVVEGKIMGTMPMKAVLRPEDLRAGFRLLNFGLLRTLLGMLFRRAVKPAPKGA